MGDSLIFVQGNLGDIWMYRNTDILTGSEWGILIIVKGRRSTKLQPCRNFLASNTFSKRRAKKITQIKPKLRKKEKKKKRLCPKAGGGLTGIQKLK